MFEVPSAKPARPNAHARIGHGPVRGARPSLLIVAGTRPECIKLAPVVRELARRHTFAGIVVNSGQHVEAVRRTFAEFGIACDGELPALGAHPNLTAASRHLVHSLTGAIRHHRPSLVVVQGDTLTAYAGARAGVAAEVPVVHVEAGLRAPSVSDPFPEEWFRRRIARHADRHFAPCASAHDNLLAEGAPAGRVHAVGNTGIDSLRTLLAHGEVPRSPAPHARTQVLVTLQFVFSILLTIAAVVVYHLMNVIAKARGTDSDESEAVESQAVETPAVA